MSSRNVVGFSSGKNQESRSPLMSIQQRMNDLFDNFFTDVDSFPSFSSSDVRFPLLNVSETDKDITVKAELPGMEEQDIKLEVDKNYLTIKGEKKSETEEKDKEGRHHLREISYGSFSRTLSFPFDINSEKAQASFSKGLLTITFQKPEEEVSTTKTIPITSA